LPDCLASRLRGTLAEVEQVVTTADEASSLWEAADRLRPDAWSMMSAVRWVRRRVQPVRAVLSAVVGLFPARFASVKPTLAALRQVIGAAGVLVALRELAADHLHALLPPVLSVSAPALPGDRHVLTTTNTRWGKVRPLEAATRLLQGHVAARKGATTMNEQPDKRQEEVALFRYGAIADLVHLEPGTPGLYKRIKDKAQQLWPIPYSRRNRLAAETIRHWLKLYRKGGFDALRPKTRTDAGSCRRMPQAVADRLLSIKECNPALTVRQVTAEARKHDEVPDDLPLPLSTVHRLLQRHGLMDKRNSTPKDRRHFAFAKAGQLWMSDVMHGPAVFVDGRRKRKTYLIAFLDDATRVVPFAAFALAETLARSNKILWRAPKRLGPGQVHDQCIEDWGV